MLSAIFLYLLLIRFFCNMNLTPGKVFIHLELLCHKIELRIYSPLKSKPLNHYLINSSSPHECPLPPLSNNAFIYFYVGVIYLTALTVLHTFFITVAVCPVRHHRLSVVGGL